MPPSAAAQQLNTKYCGLRACTPHTIFPEAHQRRCGQSPCLPCLAVASTGSSRNQRQSSAFTLLFDGIGLPAEPLGWVTGVPEA
mmetsp:Transcript_76176/g.144955  ORF Transcript_76176/g.144955 Transcript_76176/m.144955 type:complete len:84 (+) Transcript_76176:40-291(+)